MKFGYEGFWVELSLKEEIHKFKIFCKNKIKELNSKHKQKLTVGLVLEQTGLVYQRGVVKIAPIEISNIQIPPTFFRPPYLSDIFGNKLLHCTEEKGYDEPEDSDCDFYLYI